MEYIIIWRSHHREPHIDMGYPEFKNTFSSYEAAEEYAESVKDPSNDKRHYFDYEIFQTAEK